MTPQTTPEFQAWIDWRQEGAFFAPQFSGADQDRYRAEAERIEREFQER